MVSPNRIQSPLATQGSVYNLSLNDVQDQLGKPLNRMNIDELLKSVITTNSNTNPTGAPAPDDNHSVRDNITSSTNHQFTTTTTASTVKNVSSPSPSSLSSSSSSSPPAPFGFTHKSLSTPAASTSTSNEAFAQTTLEDFLLRHGGFDVDVDNPQPLAATMDPMIVVSQQPGDWLQFPINEQHRQMEVLASHLPPAPTTTTTPLLTNVPYSDNQMPMVVPVPVPPCIHPAPAPERKRRISDEMMKTTIERKQKRMIKNRESAARSRARKQAYTNKLEHEVAQLRKLNKMLTKEKVHSPWSPT